MSESYIKKDPMIEKTTQKAHYSSQQSEPFIKEHIPLADKNWFGTGGPARYYCEPQTAEEFQQALNFAKEKKLELFVLGDGANILVSDDGFDGLVIKPALKNIDHTIINKQTVSVTAGAGATIDSVIQYCLNNNISGLEEFSGIPGTIGGAVYINIHYFEFLLDQFLTSATVINKKNGSILTVDKTWFNFSYDHSKLFNKEHFLLDATFTLKRMNDTQTAFARGRYTEMIRHRVKRYPIKKTCGSFFRNFHPHEVTIEKNGKKAVWVAYYLDKIGVKGVLSSGGASVSYLHANMIEADNHATSADIINVARTMQTVVFKEFGIIPQPECQLVGFKSYPLLNQKTL